MRISCVNQNSAHYHHTSSVYKALHTKTLTHTHTRALLNHKITNPIGLRLTLCSRSTNRSARHWKEGRTLSLAHYSSRRKSGFLSRGGSFLQKERERKTTLTLCPNTDPLLTLLTTINIDK